MLGPQRASRTLLLSFLPVAQLENGKRGVGGGGHAALKAVAHSPPPGQLHHCITGVGVSRTAAPLGRSGDKWLSRGGLGALDAGETSPVCACWGGRC